MSADPLPPTIAAGMRLAILRQMRAQYRLLNRYFAILGASNANLAPASGGWNPRQTVIHLWAWQQRSIARMQAAVQGSQPVFPPWAAAEEDDTQKANHNILQAYGDTKWALARRQWAGGYRHFMALGSAFDDLTFLDSGRYPWLEGYSLADVYLGSYEHHQEHWLALNG